MGVGSENEDLESYTRLENERMFLLAKGKMDVQAALFL